MSDTINRLLDSARFSLEDFIKEIIMGHYFTDAGFIKKVSDDGKRIDVEHFIRPENYSYDDKAWKMQEATLTKNIEVLYLGSSYFKLKWKLKVNDPVLLIGTKKYIDKIEGLTKSDKAKMYCHYNQENLKAIALGFNDEAKTIIEATNEKILITTDDAIDFEIDGGGDLKADVDGIIDITDGHNSEIVSDTNTLKLKKGTTLNVTLDSNSSSVKINDHVEIL